MIKNLSTATLAALALGAVMVTSASAETSAQQPSAAQPAATAAPAVAAGGSTIQLSSAEDCKKVGLDFAQIAEDKKLPDAKLETLEDLMSRMSDFCAQQKYVEASALAKDMKTLIEKM